MDTTSVGAAFEMLIEEVEAEIDFINGQGARAFESRDYDRAKESLETAARVTAYREKVDNLRQEWIAIVGPAEAEDEETQAHRRDLGRLQRGLRTPEEQYRRPILQAILDLGGSAALGDVLDKVGKTLKSRLQAVDFEPLASNPDLPRWRNAAQWARNSMAREGLLKNNSPRGIWEISEAGKDFLRTDGTV